MVRTMLVHNVSDRMEKDAHLSKLLAGTDGSRSALNKDTL